MTMQIQVYVDIVPLAIKELNPTCDPFFPDGNTCVVQNSPPCPMLDNHGKWSDARINRDIRLDHLCVHQSKWRVDVHVAREMPEGLWSK
jgi:hypothetical protein